MIVLLSNKTLRLKMSKEVIFNSFAFYAVKLKKLELYSSKKSVIPVYVQRNYLQYFFPELLPQV